jgi:hypothetical protein
MTEPYRKYHASMRLEGDRRYVVEFFRDGTPAHTSTPASTAIVRQPDKHG